MKVDDGGALVRYGDAHVALFLHHGGESLTDGVWRSFAIAHPVLLDRMISSVRQQADEAGICDLSTELNVRCIELHLYAAGGGLTARGHNDQGSTITLSVMLSEPEPVEHGGRFSTTDVDGVVTVHELAKGDAIILCSEQVHNVSTLTHGERNSLVIELWSGATNRRDRFS